MTETPHTGPEPLTQDQNPHTTPPELHSQTELALTAHHLYTQKFIGNQTLSTLSPTVGKNTLPESSDQSEAWRWYGEYQ